RHGPKLVPARRVAARIGAGCVARLGNRTTIAFTGRLAITNSGCNAHVFHYVRHSKLISRLHRRSNVIMTKTATAISPVMRKLSAYIAQASRKALPAQVTERAKYHLLDTLAAMVSGAPLLPGRRA